jgi:thiol:disulfide interchange protein DsbA
MTGAALTRCNGSYRELRPYGKTRTTLVTMTERKQRDLKKVRNHPGIRTSLLLIFAALVSSDLAAGERVWEPGVHYAVLAPAQRTNVAPGKIELLELFVYTNDLSRRVYKRLSEWKSTAPDYVEIVRQPAIFYPHNRLQARMHYTLEKLHRPDLQLAYQDWIFDKSRFSVYHNVRHPDEKAYFHLNLRFAESMGIDKRQFTRIYNSTEISDEVIEVEAGQHQYQLFGTTTFVVNGRYCVSLQRLRAASKPPREQIVPEDFNDLFLLIDSLIAKERTRMSIESNR